MHQSSPGCWWSPTYARHADCRPQNTTTPLQNVTHVAIHTSTCCLAGGGGNGGAQATIRRSHGEEESWRQDGPGRDGHRTVCSTLRAPLAGTAWHHTRVQSLYLWEPAKRSV